MLMDALYPSHPPWPCFTAAAINCTSVTSHAQMDWTHGCGWGRVWPIS